MRLERTEQGDDGMNDQRPIRYKKSGSRIFYFELALLCVIHVPIRRIAFWARFGGALGRGTRNPCMTATMAEIPFLDLDLGIMNCGQFTTWRKVRHQVSNSFDGYERCQYRQVGAVLP
jgi:hypothetical protein